MSYYAIGQSDQFAAGQYGVGSQSYYGRDSYAVPDPSAAAPAPATASASAPDTSSSDSGSETAPAAASAPTYAGGAPSAPPDTPGDSGTSAMTLLVGLGVVTALGYYLFFRGGR